MQTRYLVGSVVVAALLLYCVSRHNNNHYQRMTTPETTPSFGDTKKRLVVVAGGAGYIGSHTIVQLLSNGYRVLCIDNLVNSSPKSLERVQQIVGPSLGKELRFVKIDLTVSVDVDALFDKYASQISSVIHFAGLKAVGESIQMPVEYYRNNMESTFNLLRAMQKHGVKQIVFSSSATVYGEGNKPPLVETMGNLSPTNPYGRTKLFIEEVLRDVCIADNTFQAVLLRYFNPVGAHPSGLIGEDPQGIPNNLMPFILQVASGRREVLSIFGNDWPTPDGYAERDFLHVMDLADGHVAALKFAEPGAHIFNLGTGTPVSVKQLVEGVESACGKKIPQKVVGRRPGDLASVYANAKKAEKSLGWQAKRSVSEMCIDGWKWASQNPNGYN